MQWNQLTFLVAVSAYAILYGELEEEKTENPLPMAFSRVLPIVTLIWMLFTSPDGPRDHQVYKNNILLGLLFSVLADVCFVWRLNNFKLFLMFLGLTRFFYVRACGYRPVGWEALFICGGSSIVVYQFLLPGIIETQLKIIGAIYTLTAFSVAWRSMVYFQSRPSARTLAILMGAWLLLGSDFVITVTKFRSYIPYGPLLSMALYYSGQLGVTLSACVEPEVPVVHPRSHNSNGETVNPVETIPVDKGEKER